MCRVFCFPEFEKIEKSDEHVSSDTNYNREIRWSDTDATLNFQSTAVHLQQNFQ